MVLDQLDLHAAPLGPAPIHALEHLGPVLAFGAAGAGVDLDEGVVAVRLAGKQRLDLVALGPRGEFTERHHPFLGQRLVALRVAELDQLDRVVPLLLDRAYHADRFIEATALLHQPLRLLRIVPQRRILDARVQLVQPADRAIPDEKAADEVERVVDRADVSLRFGAHVVSPDFRS